MLQLLVSRPVLRSELRHFHPFARTLTTARTSSAHHARLHSSRLSSTSPPRPGPEPESGPGPAPHPRTLQPSTRRHPFANLPPLFSLSPPFTLRRPLSYLPPFLLWPLYLLLYSIALVPMLAFLFNRVVNLQVITGPSMRPTLNPDVTLPTYGDNNDSHLNSDGRGSKPGRPATGFFGSVSAQLGLGSATAVYAEDARRASLWRDVVLVWRWKPWVGLSRGQVVLVVHPLDPSQLVAKRVVALSGDVVRPRAPDGVANVERDEEGWMGKKVVGGMGDGDGEAAVRVRVPEGHVWVEGDKGDESCDSNQYGAVAMGLVVGKVTRVVFPWSRWGVVHVYNVAKRRVEPGRDEAAKEYDLAVGLG